MTPKRRLAILGALLLLAIGASVQQFYSEKDSVAISEPAERDIPKVRPAASGATPARELALGNPTRLEMSVGDINPFTPKSWYVPPPPPPPQAPPKPTAPPLPFSYVGKLEEDGENWTIYLSKGNESFVIKKGDTFDSSYRFEGVEKGNLVIQYLPLGIRQTISIGAGL
ncbi:hypothetical protein PMI16_01876 [Herbaspirillum sp. CF444]|uniref:hypothetical protein n=1 Tax=Herbaspirillum sp. CF444 TaxID=1144319 RepID=UPI0002724000|nr:hypothetical protein [Herbaspirillum sp. CF444]EJL90069.1 hypothetical protein PMI16_01876 [Herbaspirillum sp. CF444]